MKSTLETVSEYLAYDPLTGIFLWKKPRGRMPAGAIAGNTFKAGNTYYRSIRFFRRQYRASNLAWLLMTGEWPNRLVDHRNNDGLDNRWENLRLATHSQNAVNSAGLASDNTSGYRGVFLDKRYKARGHPKIWYARIGHRSLGYYTTAKEAARAYDAEAVKAYGEFAYLNFA